MALVVMKKLLTQAEKHGYARRRLFLYSPLYLMGPMMLAAARNASVDIAVHLDHGLTVGTVQAALKQGGLPLLCLMAPNCRLSKILSRYNR